MNLSEAQAKLLLGKHYVPPKAVKARKQPKRESPLEAELKLQLRANKILVEQEFKFCEARRWKADFRVLNTKILIEVEGGTWSGGRHVRPKGYANDCEKYSWAAANGWVVLRYTSDQIYSEKAILGILEAINNCGG